MISLNIYFINTRYRNVMKYYVKIDININFFSNKCQKRDVNV